LSISLKPYIGSRDFYPDEMRFRSWMFSVQRKICSSYGYGEYSTPILEPLELYAAKSSEEIVSDQLYRFTDRGDREVAIRPELTPSLARIVSARAKELPVPIRMFNIGNFMRYERPGRGRLREFYQLNVDLIGSASASADVEIVSMGAEILKGYGAKNQDFLIRISDRRLMSSYFSDLSSDSLRKLGRLLDKKEKISPEDFQKELLQVKDDKTFSEKVDSFLSLDLEGAFNLSEQEKLDSDAVMHLRQVISDLEKLGFADCLKFDPAIMRGFDYYTGLIFEIYDTHPENRRALFGGGRYDKLMGLFGKHDLPAVGFGMGDVTLENFLKIHELIHEDTQNSAGIYLTLFSKEMMDHNMKIAALLRAGGLEVETSLEPTKKLGRQFEIAEKKNRKFAVVIGEDEILNKMIRIKNLQTGEQKDVSEDDMVSVLREGF